MPRSGYVARGSPVRTTFSRSMLASIADATGIYVPRTSLPGLTGYTRFSRCPRISLLRSYNSVVVSLSCAATDFDKIFRLIAPGPSLVRPKEIYNATDRRVPTVTKRHEPRTLPWGFPGTFGVTGLDNTDILDLFVFPATQHGTRYFDDRTLPVPSGTRGRREYAILLRSKREQVSTLGRSWVEHDPIATFFPSLVNYVPTAKRCREFFLCSNPSRFAPIDIGTLTPITIASVRSRRISR